MKVSTILAANSCNVSKTACGFVTTETERCLNGQTEVCGFTNEITNASDRSLVDINIIIADVVA